MADNIKWNLKNYNERVNKIHKGEIKILEYTGLSNPVKYKCPICGKIKSCNPARALIFKLSLCDECYGAEKNIVEKKIRQKFKESKKYDLLVWRGATNKLTEKCLKCDLVFDRYPTKVLQCFDFCPSCSKGKNKNEANSQEAQKRIDDVFGEKKYELLDYEGDLNKKNKVRCLNCKFIFTTRISKFLQSKGCPKCNKQKQKDNKVK